MNLLFSLSVAPAMAAPPITEKVLVGRWLEVGSEPPAIQEFHPDGYWVHVGFLRTRVPEPYRMEGEFLSIGSGAQPSSFLVEGTKKSLTVSGRGGTKTLQKLPERGFPPLGLGPPLKRPREEASVSDGDVAALAATIQTDLHDAGVWTSPYASITVLQRPIGATLEFIPTDKLREVLHGERASDGHPLEAIANAPNGDALTLPGVGAFRVRDLPAHYTFEADGSPSAEGQRLGVRVISFMPERQLQDALSK